MTQKKIIKYEIDLRKGYRTDILKDGRIRLKLTY